MVTGNEIQMYRDLSDIAKSLRRIADLLEKQAERQDRNERNSANAGSASAETPEGVSR